MEKKGIDYCLVIWRFTVI